jgi:hypothetical protein
MPCFSACNSLFVTISILVGKGHHRLNCHWLEIENAEALLNFPEPDMQLFVPQPGWRILSMTGVIFRLT